MKRLMTLVLVLLFAAKLEVFAQKATYQSLFIYNFTKYIKWPDQYGDGNLVIGVLGDSELYSSLQKMASAKKNANGRSLQIKKFNSTSDLDFCHVLFIPEGASNQLNRVLSTTRGKPVLIVTDRPGLARRGSVINFVEQDGKIKFELNKDQANTRGLKVSGSLSQLAIVI